MTAPHEGENGNGNGNGKNLPAVRTHKPGQFMPGNQIGAQRKSKGARSNAVAAEAGRALRRAKGFRVLEAIVSGDILEQIDVNRITGMPIYGMTKNADRIRAVETLLHYHVGKPAQLVLHAGQDGGPIAHAVFFLPENGRK